MNEMKNTKMGTYIHNDEMYNFNFATSLTADNKIAFVRTIVDTLVDDNYYDSIIRDVIFDFSIIMFFTDIDTSFTNAVDEDSKEIPAIVIMEQFLEETNVVDIVEANMETGLLDELKKAVDKSIEYRTGIHLSPLSDAIANLVNTLEKKINEIDLNSAMDMAQKFANMTGELNIDSIVNAYMNSDVHKKNLAEIEEAKNNEIKIDENLGEAVRTVVEENKIEDKNKGKSTKSKK